MKTAIYQAPRILTVLTDKLKQLKQHKHYTNMQISENGLKLIAQFEGCELKAYRCPAGIWSIGYGHTGDDVEPDMTITEDEAFELLGRDTVKTEKSVSKMLVTQIANGLINQNMFDALVSFAYNCGTGNLQKSTLLKKVKANPFDPSIENEFMRWTKAGGRELPGLVKRRKAEAELYFS